MRDNIPLHFIIASLKFILVSLTVLRFCIFHFTLATATKLSLN